MKRNIRILIVSLAVAGLGANCWPAGAQEVRKVQNVKEQDRQEFRRDVTDYLLDLLTKQMKTSMRMPSGDVVLNDISINSIVR